MHYLEAIERGQEEERKMRAELATLRAEAQEYRNRAEKAEAQLRERWVPVTERLPDPDADCLFASGNAVFRFRMYSHLPDGVTHWMPLPIAPEVSQ